MARQKLPSTPALRALRSAQVDFTAHNYRYEERGGTRVSSRELGVPEHHVIKTLIMEDDQREPLVVLMHGDLQVSTRNLARALGLRSVQPCQPQVAQRHSGYQVGGTSPFGLRRDMPIYAEQTIQALPELYINAGRRGLLVCLSPAELARVLNPTWVQVGVEAS